MAASARAHLDALDDCLARLLNAIERAADGFGAPAAVGPAPAKPPYSVAEDLADADLLYDPVSLVRRALRLQALLKADAEKIEEHQAFQARIAHVRDQIAEQDAARVNLVMRLHSAKVTLERALRKAKAGLVQRSGPDGRPLSVSEILNYASKLTNYTSAPPRYDPSSAEQFVEAELPFPSELAMRSTLMNQPNMGLETPEDVEQSSEGKPAAGSDFHPDPTLDEALRSKPFAGGGGAFCTDSSEDETANPLFDLDLNPDLE